MSEDLEERLKYYRVSADVNHPVHPEICDEALQEIWRLKTKLARLTAIKAELLAALEEAVYDIASWGEYADYYFQEKWDLSGDISKIEAAIEKAKQ